MIWMCFRIGGVRKLCFHGTINLFFGHFQFWNIPMLLLCYVFHAAFISKMTLMLPRSLVNGVGKATPSERASMFASVGLKAMARAKQTSPLTIWILAWFVHWNSTADGSHWNSTAVVNIIYTQARHSDARTCDSGTPASFTISWWSMHW